MAEEKDPWAGWTIVDEAAAPAASADAPSGTNAGLTAAALGKLSPKAAWELMRFGTSPTAAKTGGAIANAATTLAAAGHGLMTGNPSQVVAAPLEGWAAGKGGYFGTKALQGVARPVAAALDKAAPVASAVAHAGAVQGGLDLAQIAEPGRRDIGVFGMGGPIDGPTPQALEAVNARRAKEGLPPIRTAQEFDLHLLHDAIAAGVTPSKAAAQIAQGDPNRFGAVMAAYMKSRMVK